ncbi:MULTISPECIES: hypothetical protein [unclassified Bradyrhizobium]|uniref:hypothetical protein n=1 Tax=unclassified Bradyrhizobium TaxID=2631580 RepID=UPI001FF824EA|nr:MULTISPECIES: hypothetical protein [unclassified Bradyrhizobium]MCK1710747.1 hypothetical protein [Bradyrhizobium sp. 143]MCK1724426.1 hypothetical protein [Bradyrhizobium sp. 142]
MSVVLTLALVAAHHLKLGLGRGYVQMLSLHFDDTRLLRCKLPLSFDNLAFDLPQLIKERVFVHRACNGSPFAAFLSGRIITGKQSTAAGRLSARQNTPETLLKPDSPERGGRWLRRGGHAAMQTMPCRMIQVIEPRSRAQLRPVRPRRMNARVRRAKKTTP